MVAKCTYIRPGGVRCKGTPVRGSGLCSAHHPDYQASRQRGASKGGKTGGRGRGGGSEVNALKEQLQTIADKVLDNKYEPKNAAVAVQALNALRAAMELERRVKETEELEERLVELERTAANIRSARR